MHAERLRDGARAAALAAQHHLQLANPHHPDNPSDGAIEAIFVALDTGFTAVLHTLFHDSPTSFHSRPTPAM